MSQRTRTHEQAVARAAPSEHTCDAPTVIGRFLQRIHATPDRPAVWAEQDGEWTSMTWREIGHLSAAFGLGLRELGHLSGEALAVLGPTRPEWTVCDFGGLGIGAVMVGVYPTLTAEGVEYILDDADVTTLVVAGSDYLDLALSIASGMPKVQRIIAWDEVDIGRDERLVAYDEVLTVGEARLGHDEHAFDRLAEEVGTDQAAVIVYTSGTTGPPKGAMLMHRNLLPVMDAVEQLFPELGPDDVTIAFLPFAHVAGHALEQFSRVQIGFGAYYCPDVKRVIDVFAAAKPTMFGSVPRLYEKILSRTTATLEAERQPLRAIAGHGFAFATKMARERRKGHEPSLVDRMHLALVDRLVLSKVRHAFGGRCKLFIVGAAPIGFEVLEFCEAIGIPIYEVYGMTETASLISANAPGATKLGSVGRVIPGGEMRTDVDGEVLYRGPNVFPGYVKLERETSETIDADGWLHTGDIGVIDEDGYLRIVDRKKDLIITAGGKNVSPSNIENVLRQLPLVGEVLVHGDRRKYLTALLSLDSEELERWAAEHNLSAVDRAALFADKLLRGRLQELIDSANEKLARYERIRKWDIVPEPFSIEDGTLTPTLKVKRPKVEAKYRLLLDGLYEEPAEH
jgi:long-chain acyl-CoA synthetase